MQSEFVDRDFVLHTLWANQDRLRQEFAIKHISLYGSFARNEQTAKSDIDLVYVLREGHHLSLFNRERLQRVLKKQVRRKIGLINQKYMNPFTEYTMLKDVVYV